MPSAAERQARQQNAFLATILTDATNKTGSKDGMVNALTKLANEGHWKTGLSGFEQFDALINGSSDLGTTSADSTTSSTVASSLASTQKSLANAYGGDMSSSAQLMEQRRLVSGDSTSSMLSSGSLLALGGTLG